MPDIRYYTSTDSRWPGPASTVRSTRPVTLMSECQARGRSRRARRASQSFKSIIMMMSESTARPQATEGPLQVTWPGTVRRLAPAANFKRRPTLWPGRRRPVPVAVDRPGILGLMKSAGSGNVIFLFVLQTCKNSSGGK